MVAASRSGSTSSSWPRTSARWPCRAGLSRSAGPGHCANGNRGPATAPRWPGGRSYNDGMNDPLPPELRAELDAGLRALGLDVALATPLLAYLALLARWNATYNLTAIRDPREMVAKHLLDALAMHPHVDGIAAAGGRLADLGTGPGLPGIPLAIAKPALQVTLVESNGKKVRFLREAVRRLALPNVEVVEARIEAFDAPGRFDAITARALATLP